MEVDVTPDQQPLIRHAIERGRAEFLTRLDMARASIARGEGTPITQESMRELAEDVKQRGRERLAAERHAPV